MSEKKTLLPVAIYAMVSLMVLYLGYALNLWRAVDFRLYTEREYGFMERPEILGPNGLPESLLTFDRYSESLVMGRLLASDAQGLLSQGGFVGWLTATSTPPEGVDDRAFRHAYQYKMYLEESSPDVAQGYRPYGSQIGGQAFVLGILDSILPFRNATKLRLYYHLMAFLTAVAVTLILLWFFLEFGSVVGWFLTVCFSLLCYPTLYARSLWWVLWAFYIPFVVMLHAYRNEERADRPLTYRALFALMFLAMLLKVFFNGCEYITTAVLMALVPQCYYAIKNRWTVRHSLRRFAVSLSACILAVGIFFLIVSFQFVLIEGTFWDGINHIYDRLMVRTHGAPERIAKELMGKSRSPSSLLALLRYFCVVPVVVDFRNMGIDFVAGMKSLFPVYVCLTVGWVLAYRRWKTTTARPRMTALLITFWLSLLAPLSWFVIFKGHSDEHRGMLAAIVWYMPFMFYGMALVGASLDALIRRGRISVREGAA